MKNFILLLFFIIAVNAFGATAPYKITNDKVKMGNGTTSSKGFEFDMGLGVLNPTLNLDNGTGFSLSKDLSIVGGLSASGVLSSTATGTHTLNGPLTTKAITSQGNTFTLGDGAASAKKIELNKGAGANNPYIAWDEAQSALTFSNDGTLVKKLGSGSGSGGDGGVNLLTNASFEDGAAFGWTNSGGTFSVATYATGTEDNLKYAEFVATSASQTLCSNLASTPTYFGAGGMVDFSYTGTGSAFIAYVLDGSSNKLTANQALLNQTTWAKLSPIPFSLNSSQKLCFESMGAGTIKIDKTYLGNNKNVNDYTVSNKTYDKTVVTVTSNQSGWVIDYANFYPYKVINKTTGAETWRMTYSLRGSATSAARTTNTLTISGISMITGQPVSATNGALQAIYSVTTSNGIYIEHTSLTTSNYMSNGDVELIGKPTWADDVTTTQVQTPEASQWFIDANIGGASIDLGASQLSSYTEATSPSLDLVINSSKSNAQVTIACANGYDSGGLTCQTSDESIGIVFTPPYSGVFEACMDIPHYFYAGTTMDGSGAFQLIETTPTSSSIIQEGSSRVAFRGNHYYLAGIINALHVCGTFKFNDTSRRAIRLMREQAGNWSMNAIAADRSSTNGQRDIHITVRPLLQNSLRAILTGDQVRSKDVVKPHSFNFAFGDSTLATNCSSGTCGLSSIGGEVTSVTWLSAGVYRALFDRTFSKVICTGIGHISGTGVSMAYPDYNSSFSCVNCSSMNMTFVNTSSNSTNTLGNVSCLAQE